MTAGGGFKSGFISVVGRPNVGKSTLMNRLVGAKVAITSPKPQTTRTTIRGVRNGPGYQAVFVDTPGSQKPRDALRRRMQERVVESMKESDVLLFVLDASQPIGKGDTYIAQLISRAGTPTVAAVNKVDLLRDRSQLLPVLERVAELGEWEDVFPVSAVSGENTETMLDRLVSLLPEGPRYFPEGTVTDFPEAFILAEYIREKALNILREEVPHAIAVEVEEVERKGEVTVIYAIIHVERPTQRMIVLGKDGRTIKTIGTQARKEVERLLGTRIYLNLTVKVTPRWRRDEKFLERLGL
ncbi:GTPase Era [Rubrobacter taiwanensis]|uniref:GTPase Era n=1 Tax=Rubrobacter taiwanensis TaxID=185139 RepID=A0A4V2NWG6_9ACTN|nr:GTPase Era [Rubrobacter taiwanensis]TCJ17312.1 GTPase Era [Rubrobacter taiwanensis]